MFPSPFGGGALGYYTHLGAPEPRPRLPLEDIPGNPVIGSMSRAWKAWKSHGAPRLLYQWLRSGVPIRWKGAPPQARAEEERGTQSEEVRQEMKQLLRDGAFMASNEEGVITSPVFLIPKRSGGKRLIHDLRAVNAHIAAPHFTLHGARDAAAVVRNSNWLCTLDLKRGYQQIYMERDARRFLGAKVGDDTVVSLVLPFGLALSPYIFTRFTNWLARLVRRRTGLHVAVYIDDFIVGSETKEKLEEGLVVLRSLFKDLGVVLSEEKSSSVSKEVEFLGFQWSAATKTIKVTEDRRKEYRRALKNLARTPQPVTRWRNVIGKLIFLREAIGPTLRHTRSLLRSIRGRKLGARVVPSQEAREDLHWWIEALAKQQEMSLAIKETTASITTDASEGKLGYILEMGKVREEKTLQADNEAKHINTKELEALYKCLVENQDILRGRKAIWYSDNVTAKACVTRQGTQAISKDTWETTKKVIDLMERNNISLIAKHVPGALNCAADSLSRPDEEKEPWAKALEAVTGRWGPLEIDPYGFIKQSSGPVEDLHWADKRALLKPRVTEIPRLLGLLSLVKLEQPDKAPASLWPGAAVVITPTWRGAIWWEQLEQLRTDWIELGRISDRNLLAWQDRNGHEPSWTASLVATGPPSGRREQLINIGGQSRSIYGGYGTEETETLEQACEA